jgi:uncharacterized protein YbjT (DUF2867 family)
MTSDRTILITGVTGNQGGAVAQALTKSHGFKLRGLTRMPNGPRAAAMARTAMVRPRGLQRKHRWTGTRVRPRAHDAPGLGTPRATKWARVTHTLQTRGDFA